MSRLLFIVLSMLVMLCGCSKSAPPPPSMPAPDDVASVRLHNAAVAAMGRYDYAAAFEQLHTITQSNPMWMDGLVDLSIAQLNRQLDGDEVIALKRLETVLKSDGEHLRANYVKGLLLLNAGDSEGALACFERVAVADSGDAYAAYYTGQSLGQLGRSADAVPWFATAIAMDPYLRSSYYAGAQSARRSGDAAQADAWLAIFQRMEHNPRAVLAQLKYTRMGPKAVVQAIVATDTAPPSRPEGPVFAAQPSFSQASSGLGRAGAISVGSIGDGRSIVLVPGQDTCTVFLLDGMNVQKLEGHPFTRVSGLKAALWGDVDGDGRVDVVLCCKGGDELWRGIGGTKFDQDTRFPGGFGSTMDGALFDADHDGDLDVLRLGGLPELLNNNGDGTWTSVSDPASGFPRANRFATRVVVADFDGDLDTDVLFCCSSMGPSDLWINDRLWNWHSAGPEFDPLLEARIHAAAAVDFDGDGEVELVVQTPRADLMVWSRPAPGRSLSLRSNKWSSRTLLKGTGWGGNHLGQLAVADFTGDGRMDVLASMDGGFGLSVVDHTGAVLQRVMANAQWTLLQQTSGRGPSLCSTGGGMSLVIVPPGSGRFPFVDIELSGRIDPGQTMRSNASGIGATLAARVGARWTITGAVRNTAGPGQNLQPISIGLGGADAIDFVAIDWSDGVYQTEANLKPGELHTIVETQRQLSSCPVLFGWNGERMAFITDALGVGGLGFLLKPGTYAEPRPWERVLLPDGALQPRDGMLDMIIAEPMQETCYLDDVTLLSVDLPEGWEVLPDERMGTGGAPPTGELLFSQHSMSPYAVHTMDGRDITAEITQRDGIAADPGPVHTRFIGRTVEPFELVAFFDEGFDAHEGTPLLVLDAWVEYPYAQTMFAAWQAGVAYAPLSIEVQVNGDHWVEVAKHVGYPAGMPRTMVLPLPSLPAGAKNLRISTTLECYIDNLRIAWAQPCPEAVVHESRPAMAELFEAGYPTRTDGPHRRPHYDWAVRSPFWDTRTQRGLYSALGDVLELVRDRDGALAVFGVGEAVRVSFSTPEALEPGMHRRHVLDLGGWAKDMDFMTHTGATVDPIPGARDSTSASLMEATRTRYRDGR